MVTLSIGSSEFGIWNHDEFWFHVKPRNGSGIGRYIDRGMAEQVWL